MLKKRKKFFKWLTIIAGLVIVLGATAIFLAIKWKPIVANKLKSVVFESSNHLYAIKFKDIHLNILTGTMVIDSLVLSPDSHTYDLLKAKNEAPTHLFRVKMLHLKLRRLGILTAYFNKKINIGSIEIDNPSIDMIYQKVPKRKMQKDTRTLYQQIAKDIKSIKVKRINVINADFDYYNGIQKLNSIKQLAIKVKDVLIDSVTQYDTTRELYAKDIGFALAGYRSLTKDKMYTLKADAINGSLTLKTLNIKGFKLQPKYPELIFSRKYKVQKDRYDLNFSELNFEGIDYLKLNNDGDLQVKSLKIGKAKVAIFMNREFPPPAIDKGRNYPHVALKRLPISTLIENVHLNKIDVFYTEYNPKTKQKGTLLLENLSGNIVNITNDSVRLSTKKHAFANLTTNLMGFAKMKIGIDFNLTDPAATFSYNGHIEPLNLNVLNPLSKPLGSIAIESGKVQNADFKITANLKKSKGEVKFRYTNLKVNLLQEGNANKAKEQGLLSFLANTILIKDSNPAKGESQRVANITFERVPQASFFNLMWKSVFLGIREIVGIGMVPMKKMQAPKSAPKRKSNS